MQPTRAMSLTSFESGSTGTTDSSTSKSSFGLSGQYGYPPPLSMGAEGGTGSISSFTSRRGNIKYSSARFNLPSRSIRNSKRSHGMSSFGRSTRRTAARPARTRELFEKLLSGLAEGVVAVKGCIEDMKENREKSQSRVNYYRDLEKQIKVLERKVRTLEVHRDRIEEMRDEYILKLKLREGAFNIAQALANQTSKAAKEKLQEARVEQRDLLEDLCDIEDELETKLGVFKVHINELLGLGRGGGGGGVEFIETQFKLGSQKWKSKCRVNRHEQTWQDEDIIFLGKVMDELFVKVVEVKKIQGNVLLGNMKCQTREFFSFYPMTVTYDFPTSTAKLSMNITWSPTIGEDFLSDLDLKTVQCIVGGAQKSPNRMMGTGNVERLRLRPTDPLCGRGEQVRQIRIITEPAGEDLDTQSYGKAEVKPQSMPKPKKEKKKKKKDNSEFVFMDRQSIIDSQFSEMIQQEQQRQQQQQQQIAPPPEERRGNMEEIKVIELCSSPKKHKPVSHPLHQDSRDSSLGSNNSSGSGQSSGGRQHQRQCTPEAMSLLGMLEAVMAALEEPKELYTELHTLDLQLSRLEVALRGGQLIRAPSMTLSESQAMDTFEFLGSEDNILAHRFSKTSIDMTECLGHRRSNSAQMPFRYNVSGSESNTTATPTPTSGSQVDMGMEDLQRGSPSSRGSVDVSGTEGEVNGNNRGTSGSPSVDRALVQHLIHCESLLVHLHSSGPLKYKLSSALKKLQREAEVISELLNIAAEPTDPPQVHQILPELAADDQLMRFWRSLTRDDVLSVSYEQFAVKVDEKFGHSLWSEFPEIANKVLTMLMSRVLDLEIEDWELDDGLMVVTIFQYSSYFMSQGNKGIAKCLSEVARELKVTEGLETNEAEVKRRIASMLPTYGYNKGALLATTHLLSDSDSALQDAALKYVANFSASSPWHSKAVQCLIELLEHSDQKVRIGACNALASLKATSAASQLKYLSCRDFSDVRVAATRALQEMGNMEELEASGDSAEQNGEGPVKQLLSTLEPVNSSQRKHTNLQRTRSAELH